MTTITGMKILMVLGANTGATGVTVTITVPSTDLVGATSHSWASIISSILLASKDLSSTPHRIQSVPIKDLLLTMYRIQSPPIKDPGTLRYLNTPCMDPGIRRFPNILCQLDSRCQLLILQFTNPFSQP